MRRGRFAAALLLALTGLGTAHANDLLNRVVLVKDATAQTAPQPLDSNQQSAVTFTVSAAQAGRYTITVTDLQTPAPLGKLSVSLSTPTASIVQIAGAAGSAPQSMVVTLAAGTYAVQPLATGGSAGGFPEGGAFSVVVTPQGSGQSFWQDQWVVAASGTPTMAGQSILSQEFTISDAGGYMLALTDQNFPNALHSLEAIVLPHGGTSPLGILTTPGSTSLGTLAAGNYDLFVVAQADTSTSGAGLYSVAIVGGSMGTSVGFAGNEPVGKLPAPTTVAVPASGAVTLAVNDLQFPAALASGSLQFVATEGANLLTPSSGQYAASAGNLQVFATAQPGVTGQGAYSVYATQGGQTLADIAVPVFDSSHYGYAYVPSSPLAAGSYQLGVNDYQIPQALGGLNAGVVQQGVLISGSKISNTSATATFSASAGVASILVFPLLMGSTDNSLLGVVLSSAVTSAVVFNTTNGIGALFSSTAVTVPSGGSYAVQADDLGFPAKMSSLAVIVTGGQAVAGSIYGGGIFYFTAASAGTYVVNVLAQVASGQDYGLYGVQVSPAATVTLTASPTTVTSGHTATLAWSSANTTSCTAGNGWSSSQATSGTQVTTALTANTSFSITCSGDGGTATATTLVEVTAAPKAGGGGAIEPIDLLALLLAASWLLRRRPVIRN